MTPEAQLKRTALLQSLEACGCRLVSDLGRTLRLEATQRVLVAASRHALQDQALQLYLMVGSDCRKSHGRFEVYYLFAEPRQDWFLQLLLPVPEHNPWFPSLATLCYPASRYEREIHDLLGLEPRDHPDLRPLVRHGFWPADYYPLRKDAQPPRNMIDDGSPFPFQQVEGKGIYEIPVGPVHAGIIEPGHFRFSVDGETIIDMKARLYFTHKGTEKLFEGKTPQEGVELAERISGDSSVGHCLAYCTAIESLAETGVPLRAQYWRVILLELERLYNHVADFGAIANDTGFALANAHALRIRETLLRLNLELTGHRLLRGLIVPGGLSRDLDKFESLARALENIREDFNEVVEMCLANSMLLDRLRGVGRLSMEAAQELGILGYAARASGVQQDVRSDHPFAAYERLSFGVPTRSGGDVEARTMIRVEEFRIAVDLIQQALQRLPEGLVHNEIGKLPEWESAFGLVEGWRGGILHWVMAGPQGRLYRVKIKDPSFLNWQALSQVLPQNIVPDFPLCNKSFNLSYSGNDL